MKPNKGNGIIKKSLLYLLVFIIAFLLSNMEIPQFPFLKSIYPHFVVLNIENSLLTIGFLLIALKFFGKNYLYLFRIDPLKKVTTYIWVVATVISIFLLIVLFTEATGLSYYFSPLSPSYFLLLLVRVAIIVPIEEELFFRGLLLLVPRKKIRYVMFIVTTVYFAMVHNDSYIIVWLGLGFGFLAIRFNNIWVPILAHALWNLLASFFMVSF